MRFISHLVAIITNCTAWIRKHSVLAIYMTGWLIYFSYFWLNAIQVDSTGNIHVSHLSIWGDWAAHFTMGSAMAERGLILFQSPFLIGAPFSYPFVANAFSAALIQLGVPFFAAFIVPSFLFSLVLVAALFWFYHRQFKLPIIALLASLIFLFNGGTGFTHYYQDITQSTQPFTTALNPPQEYTSMQDHFIRWISVINSQLIPQRAFTMGFSLAVIALTLIWFYGMVDHRTDQTNQPRRALSRHALPFATVLMGLMPIIHTHSFFACGIILSFWLLARLTQHPKEERLHELKKWLGLALGVSVIALPLLKVFFLSNASTQGFIKWFPGWYIQEFKVNWFVFWFKNWGVTPVLAMVGLFLLVCSQKDSPYKPMRLY
jgi:hypothetical protein